LPFLDAETLQIHMKAHAHAHSFPPQCWLASWSRKSRSVFAPVCAYVCASYFLITLPSSPTHALGDDQRRRGTHPPHRTRKGPLLHPCNTLMTPLLHPCNDVLVTYLEHTWYTLVEACKTLVTPLEHPCDTPITPLQHPCNTLVTPP
jgi:hypothetical protein